MVSLAALSTMRDGVRTTANEILRDRIRVSMAIFTRCWNQIREYQLSEA